MLISEYIINIVNILTGGNIILIGGNMKKAFTLAEVLITLGIIGIVAAISIPTLIAKYQKSQTVTTLKESYSILQQAMRLSQDENGEVDSWDTTLNGHDFFHKYLANYLKWQSEYTSTELKKTAPRYCLNGTPYTGTFYTQDISSHFTLLNGSMITTQIDGVGMTIGIDVNGLSKPNKVGRDNFMFYLTPRYGLVPLGGKGTTAYFNYGNRTRNDILKPQTLYSCNKNQCGYWCSSVIISDNWQISGDYPW
jgi:prepilin-type cleavage/methylation N-terminal domain protein